jgi:nitrite reductase/ring-hydroxylating ferredoxin subunit
MLFINLEFGTLILKSSSGSPSCTLKFHMKTASTSMKKLMLSFAIVVVVTLHGGNALVTSPSTKAKETSLFSLTSSSSSRNIDDAIPTTIITTKTKTTKAVSSSSDKLSFDNFNYELRWYPVIWARDLLTKEPTKVTIFDFDYVVAKVSDTEVIALEDRCPHKAASLSEGRVTETGNFQCAYHGWAFDGKTGLCKDIPQLAQADGEKISSVVFPSRSCARAIPAQIHQEMVYLFVGGSMEDALTAPPPPTVLEYDELGFRMSCSIRDMPVDWPIVGKVVLTILIEFLPKRHLSHNRALAFSPLSLTIFLFQVSNICDAEHGAFAHQYVSYDLRKYCIGLPRIFGRSNAVVFLCFLSQGKSI